jgi:predicted ribosomally synthesized peptide with SipW-like signal peptide
MKKIILSLLTIGLVGGGATYATFAYFNSVQTVQANTISTGTMTFEGLISDPQGDTSGNSGKFSTTDLVPGGSFTRCLWVRNSGSVAGRYKIYQYAESGEATLGNYLTVTAVLNPTSGDCSAVPTSFITGYTKYGGPDDLQKPDWINVAVRGPFFDPNTTPFKILSGEPAMLGHYYSLFRITVTLSSAADLQNANYVSDVAIFGMQDAGSGPLVTPAW